tara:strand:+ start:107 stop:277 length:171 start_codon:yes stop_codon:yes gene_type:complete
VQEHRELLEHKVFRERQVQLDLQDLRVQVHREQQVLKVLLVLLDRRVLKEHKVISV